jgi:hypothetical protein
MVCCDPDQDCASAPVAKRRNCKSGLPPLDATTVAMSHVYAAVKTDPDNGPEPVRVLLRYGWVDRNSGDIQNYCAGLNDHVQGGPQRHHLDGLADVVQQVQVMPGRFNPSSFGKYHIHLERHLEGHTYGQGKLSVWRGTASKFCRYPILVARVAIVYRRPRVANQSLALDHDDYIMTHQNIFSKDAANLWHNKRTIRHYIPDVSESRQEVISEFHDPPCHGHIGIAKTWLQVLQT